MDFTNPICPPGKCPSASHPLHWASACRAALPSCPPGSPSSVAGIDAAPLRLGAAPGSGHLRSRPPSA